MSNTYVIVNQTSESPTIYCYAWNTSCTNGICSGDRPVFTDTIPPGRSTSLTIFNKLILIQINNVLYQASSQSSGNTTSTYFWTGRTLVSGCKCQNGGSQAGFVPGPGSPDQSTLLDLSNVQSSLPLVQVEKNTNTMLWIIIIVVIFIVLLILVIGGIFMVRGIGRGKIQYDPNTYDYDWSQHGKYKR
jgi:hypothetical protein